MVVGMRSLPGNPYDGHTLHLALEQAAVLMQQQPKEVFVDLGYRGATVPAGVKVYHRKLRRGITARLKRDIGDAAIEPVNRAYEKRRPPSQKLAARHRRRCLSCHPLRLRTQPADDSEEAAASSCLDFPTLGLATNQ